jgi:hypothetical protein
MKNQLAHQGRNYSVDFVSIAQNSPSFKAIRKWMEAELINE